jgi:hypothetical protein
VSARPFSREQRLAIIHGMLVFVVIVVVVGRRRRGGVAGGGGERRVPGAERRTIPLSRSHRANEKGRAVSFGVLNAA